MAVCVSANSQGFLGVVNSTPENCADLVIVSASEYHRFLEYTSISWDSYLTYFMAGFTCVFVFGYLSTFVYGAAVSAIRKL